MEDRKSRYEFFLEDEAHKAQPTKRCTKCKEVKAQDEFYKNTYHRKHMPRPACKECMKDYRRYKQNKYHGNADRFWKKFHSVTVLVDGCLEWTAGYSHGYPVCRYQNKRMSVARLVYILTQGDLSSADRVLLTCNNKRCVRQNHLKKGSVSDVVVKACNSHPVGDDWSATHPPNKRACGERNRHAKLSNEKIILIRKLRTEQKMTQQAIGNVVGVTKSTVGRVLNGKIWAHVQ